VQPGGLVYEMPNPKMWSAVYSVSAEGQGRLHGVIMHRETVEAFLGQFATWPQEG
jgi:hypothetical protein